MLRKYGKGQDNVLLTDPFFVATIAALGWARNEPTVMPLVESRQAGLIDLLNTSTSSDPMILEDNVRGLNKIVITTKGSVGKKKRDMIYLAWKQYFINGATNPSYPVNWQEMQKLSL